MILIFLTTLFISFCFSIILRTTPISMGLWVFGLALSTALISSLIFNKWLRFLIFLIYIGGLLVMFAYFAAVAPNQQLNIINLFLNIIFTFVLFIGLISTLPTLIPIQTLIAQNQAVIQLLFSKNILIIIFLGIILFLALIAVVKVSSLSKGPLRPFNYV